MIVSTCPVCQFGVASTFFDGGMQPLATLGWPVSKEVAQSMPTYPLDYVQCLRCTHVWNRSFSYEAIPYENNPNRMFNSGVIWQGHLKETRDLLISQLPILPIVVDVGCGEGHFVRGIAECMNGKGRFMGFDPNTTGESGRGVEFHPRYFMPLEDIPNIKPDLIVMRHVIEHLTEPASFIDQLAVGSLELDKPLLFFVEVPCIDRVMDTLRLGDFFYEHPSQFTTHSFNTLMQRGGEVLNLAHGYDGEVVFALVRIGISKAVSQTAKKANEFDRGVGVTRATIRDQLEQFIAEGKSLAIWGGTGKAAAFIHQFDITSDEIPIVVDSDSEKVGTFVPKSGHAIQFRDVLKFNSVDIVIIPPQWRARDIVDEMNREGIQVPCVLIEHKGRLIDFHLDSHPYGAN